MHRDTQIGLAMAIVLIGFAAALCFPREGAPLPPAPELSDTAELDTALELSPVKIYREPEVAAEVQLTTALPQGIDPVEPLPAAGELPSQLTSTVNLPAVVDSPATLLPVEIAVQVDAFDLDPPEDGPVAGFLDEEAEPQYHVVRSGDTLSGLAQRYLGSTADYPELFAANRDILESPDSLQLGMRLKIPRRAPENRE